MYYLEDHPPARRQFAARPTGVTPIKIVVHTSEAPPDVTPPDDGAEGLGRYIARRSTSGCYHSAADSDTLVRYVNPDMQCWGARFVNPFALHISHATKAALWGDLPWGYVEPMLRNSAREVAGWCKRYNIPVEFLGTTIEARDSGKPGITSHALVDPDRRTDPGTDFPWSTWLSWIADYSRPAGGPYGARAPQFAPPLELRPIVSWCVAPNGGVWMLADNGDVYAAEAPYYGGPNNELRDIVYDVLGTPVQIRADGAGYTVITDQGYGYTYTP